jgi:hypothetical protein
MVVNSYRASVPDSSMAAAHDASERTQAGTPAHVEYNRRRDEYDVVTDEPDTQHTTPGR